MQSQLETFDFHQRLTITFVCHHQSWSASRKKRGIWLAARKQQITENQKGEARRGAERGEQAFPEPGDLMCSLTLMKLIQSIQGSREDIGGSREDIGGSSKQVLMPSAQATAVKLLSSNSLNPRRLTPLN